MKKGQGIIHKRYQSEVGKYDRRNIIRIIHILGFFEIYTYIYLYILIIITEEQITKIEFKFFVY